MLLLPARTDTRWFHNFIYKQHEIRFIRGRLKFNDCNNSAPFPSMVVVMKVDEGEFMKEDLLKIINHYGINKQLKYIHTEYFELDEAIMDYITRDENMYKDREHIAEEIADVMVMLKQFQYYYGIDNKEIEAIMRSKVERQLKRIEQEGKDEL